MNISYNWLKTYIAFDYDIYELDNILTMLGFELDSYQVLDDRYSNFTIGKIKQVVRDPSADALSICQVDIEGYTMQIVCGAPNVAVNQKVVVATEGAVIPSNRLKIVNRNIRGHLSEGMICSQAELEFGSDSSGIWVLPDDAPVGVPFVEYMDIDDIILEISLTPNKADCASHLGVAREIAAYMREKIQPPAFLLNETQERCSDHIDVSIEDEKLCQRYIARVIRNVKNGESPLWLKNALLKTGIRPINIVVDVTNYVLMEYGHPLHAFDLNKIAGNTITVKTGFDGCKFTTLDGKERTLDGDMLMICDADKPIAIAGVMGGENAEITDDTTDVVLEAAYFAPSSVRRTAKKLGLATDASYRFERGTDINALSTSIDRAAQLIAELAQGHVLSEPVERYPNIYEPLIIELPFEKVMQVIGADVDTDDIMHILYLLDFTIVDETKSSITVEVPSRRRHDVGSYIDLIEEIARLINYDNIEPDFTSAIDFNKTELPATLTPLPVRNRIRTYCANSGFCEILTHNMTDPYSASLFTDKAITINNPLGGEMSNMRPSMITQMLKTIAFNIRQGSVNLKLFETGKVFLPYTSIANSFIDNIDEREHFVLAVTGSIASRQWAVPERKFDFFDMKGYIEDIFNFFNIRNYKIKPLDEDDNVFDKNSAKIVIDKRSIGKIGGISKNILKKYDIENQVFIADIDITELSDIEIPPPLYQPVTPYPVIMRDLSFIIDDRSSASDIIKNIKGKASSLLQSIDVFDVYQGKNIEKGKKNIGFSLTFGSSRRTLTDVEIEGEIAAIVNSIEKNFDAQLRKF